MNKESLIKAKQIVLEAINGLDIEDYDKIELLINLNTYLNPENYEDDTKVLMREFFKRREKKFKK
jgi:hypothetical protein